MKRLLTFIHPFLFALYPVVFLYSLNIHEYPENTVIVPCLIVLSFAAVVFLVTRFLLKRTDKAAIEASAFIFLSLSYGRFLESIEKANMFSVISAAVVVFCAITYAIVRYQKNLVILNKLLTFLSAGLIVFSLYTIISFELKTGRLWAPAQPAVKPRNAVSAKNVPDIYYFIFDRYAGAESLKNEYTYDNSSFFNFLKKKGFYVAEEATANYPKTFLSLGSSLNMEYLDYFTLTTHGGVSQDETIVTPLIRSGKVIQFLKSKGYYFINIGPKTWTPTSENPQADKNFVIQKGTYFNADAFTTGFLNTTLASPLLAQIFRDPLDVSQDPNNNEHRKSILYQLNAVEQAIPIKSPKFVFVHILFPHDPFVFDKNCNPIPETVVDKNDHVTNYLNQLQCANKKIKNLINDILSKSKTPPVILLQSDEGPFPMKSPVSKNQSWATAADESLREKFPILNAYYLPDVSKDALYPSITPVNSFRVLFNAYFGTNYSLLEDKNYIFQDENNLYKFIDVTDKVKQRQLIYLNKTFLKYLIKAFS